MNRIALVGLLFVLLALFAAGAFMYSRQRAFRDETSGVTPPSPPGPPVSETKPDETTNWQVLAYTTTSAGTEFFTVTVNDAKRRIVFTDKDEDLKVKQVRRAATATNQVLATLAKKGTDVANILGFISTDSTAKITRLLENFGASEAPIPSPDGKRIAYIVFSNADPDYGYSLFVMNTDGSNKRRLVQRETLVTSPAFSPDGKTVAVAVATETGMAIQTAPVDGSAQPTALADFPNELVYDLSWGTELVFGKRPKEETSANQGEIYRMDATGGTRSRVTNNDQYDGTPVLSLDGKFLALVRTTFATGKVSSAGELMLIVINLSEGSETELGSADGVLGIRQASES